MDRYLLGLEYRDSEVAYNSEISSEGEPLQITAPWRRIRMRTGSLLPLPDDHQLQFGVQAGLEERGYLLRFPLGPFLDYQGKVGTAALGVSAYGVYMRDILGQEYEIVGRLEPRIGLLDDKLQISAWVGNENPYEPNGRVGLGVTWVPRPKGSRPRGSRIEPTLSSEGEYIQGNLARGALTAGLHYAIFESPEGSESKTEKPDRDGEVKKPSRYLYGRWHVSSGAGIGYDNPPFSREPSDAYEPPHLEVETEDYRDLIEICCDPDAIEDLVNAGIAEQGPVDFNWNTPAIWGGMAQVAGNLYTNPQRSWQLFWLLDAMALGFPGEDVSMTRIHGGLGGAYPLELGRGWAFPLRVAGGGGWGTQNIPLDFYGGVLSREDEIGSTGTGLFGQVDLLEKSWGNRMTHSATLFARGGEFFYPVDQYYYDEGEKILYWHEQDVQDYGLLGVRFGFGPPLGRRVERVVEKRKEERVKIVEVEAHCPEARPCPECPPCPEPVIVQEERFDPDQFDELEDLEIQEEIKRFEDTLNASHIIFQNDEPKPGQDRSGYDRGIRDVKTAAQRSSGWYDPHEGEQVDMEKVRTFIEKFKPEQFLKNEANALLLIDLSRSMKEVLTDNPGVKIVIYGHASSEGTEEYNTQLSQNRADLIRYYLILLGVDGDRLEARAQGEREPMYPEEEMSESYRDAAYEVNRRVIFKIEPII